MPVSKRPRGPAPGSPVRGSKSGRPIMALLDLLGRRPTLRLLWELRGGEPLTFRALAAAAETNPGSLNRRLAELREVGVLAAGPEGYALTGEGRALLSALGPLWEWAVAWASRVNVRRSSEEPTADP